MKKLAVLLIALSFIVTGCAATCKYRNNAVKQDSSVQSDTTTK